MLKLNFIEKFNVVENFPSTVLLSMFIKNQNENPKKTIETSSHFTAFQKHQLRHCAIEKFFGSTR